MKSLHDVTLCLLQDLGQVCDVSTNRDASRVTVRFEHEGVSFLTITLPAFAQSLERALERGWVAPTDFAGFRRRGGLPLFLGGFLELVFDRSSGRILDAPSADAVRGVRQLCLLHSRVNLACSDERVQAAFAKYVQCENELRLLPAALPKDELDELKRLFCIVWGGVASDVARQLDEWSLAPKHGPGATADGLRGNRKWRQVEWPVRSDRSFPADQYLLPNHRHWADLQHVQFVEPGAERPVKVITVPKTLKTPRIIAVEPTCMQYMQQALLSAIMRRIERDDLLSRFVGFSDQTENRALALKGSSDGSLATLDLSEASDRVSNHLVWNITKPFGAFHQALQDSRSRRADVPGYGVIRLAKFASMGSATCFPIEAMVFFTVVLHGYQKWLSRSLTHRDLEALVGKVRVYGDDIICPVDCVNDVRRSLNLFGFRVNDHKSFWNGQFRESCGGDYFDGSDVSVIRCRRVLPQHRQDAEEVLSAFSLRNQCYKAGYWRTARHLDTHLGSLRIPLPRVAETSPVLGRHSFLGYETQRMDPDTQSPQVRGLRVRATSPSSLLDGVPALMKVLLHRGEKPLQQDHLQRSGRPDRVRTKVGWGQPF